MALANYAATQVIVTYKELKGKKPLITGNMLSILHLLKDPTDNQDIDFESFGKFDINIYLDNSRINQ